jgi:hypothetical protein
MSSRRTAWIALVVFLPLCCCCAVAVAIASLSVSQAINMRRIDWSNPWSVATSLGIGNEAILRFDYSLLASEPVSLIVEVPVGDVHVKAGANGQVTIEGSKRAWGWTRAQAEAVLNGIGLDLQQAGDQVRVVADGLTGASNVPRSPQVDVTVTVPRDTAVTVQSIVGRILVSGTHGDLNLKTGMGEVALRDVLPNQRLDLQSQVAAAQLAAPLVDGASYRLTSDVGRITVSVPPESTFSLDARSDVGTVDVAFPLVGHSAREGFVGDQVRGTVGATPTAELYLRSRVGNITVGPNR